MAQFKAIAPNVEVNGQTVLAIVAGVSSSFKEKVINILAKYDIADPKPESWYPQQKWLDAFKEISETIGSHTLFSIGKSIPDNADFPPEIDNLEKALGSIDVAYHMNHRGGEIGYYKVVEFDSKKRKAVMECKNPYPCHFDRGIIMSMSRQFKPKDSLVTNVALDESKPTRLNGEDSSTYIITW